MKRFVMVAALVASVCTTPVFAQGMKLKTESFPDGTGSIGLAPGWHIDNAYRGSVACAGPKDAAVILKLPWVIMRPESSVAALPGAAQQPMAPAGNVIAGLREVLLKKSNGAILKRVRAQQAPRMTSGPPAYLLHYEYTQNGKAMTGIGYFAVLDYGPSQPMWQLYSSAVVAPTAQFAKLAPAMLAMWKSWHANGEEPMKGSTSAMFDKIINDRKLSYERIQEKFREQL